MNEGALFSVNKQRKAKQKIHVFSSLGQLKILPFPGHALNTKREQIIVKVVKLLPDTMK